MKYNARRIIALFIIGLLLGNLLLGILLLPPFILSGNSTAGAQPVIADTARMETTSAVESPATAESEIVMTPIYDVPLTVGEQQFVEEIAEQFGIQPQIIFGIMYVESGFDNAATSEECIGIMQVDKNYAPQWVTNSEHLIKQYNIPDVSDLHDFKLNVILGCQAYSEWRTIIQTKGMRPNLDTLGAYNNGYNYIAQPDYKYAANVLAFATTLQQGYKVTQPDETTQL